MTKEISNSILRQGRDFVSLIQKPEMNETAIAFVEEGNTGYYLFLEYDGLNWEVNYLKTKGSVTQTVSLDN